MSKRKPLKLPIPDNFGPMIQARRKEMGIKAAEMAEFLDYSIHHYSEIENNRSKPGYLKMILMLRQLNVDMNMIVFPERENLSEDRLQMIHAIETCSQERFNAMFAFWKYLEDAANNHE